jgi:predicted dithiol-disulfide oxidoreductase (DUF899 family)|tara:strand:+ start:904 stop:1089 length:186 start_codon:yes stop_codon:yes gene_type:complete
MLYGELANESAAYRAARAELLQAEIALRDQREKVAELRRRLAQFISPLCFPLESRSAYSEQ